MVFVLQSHLQLTLICGEFSSYIDMVLLIWRSMVILLVKIFFFLHLFMVVDLLHSKSISMILNNIKLQQVARIKLLLNWILSKSLALYLFYCSQIHCTIAEISPFLLRFIVQIFLKSIYVFGQLLWRAQYLHYT